MVKIMENPYERMDDLGGKPTIFGNTHTVDGRNPAPPWMYETL